VRGAEEILDGGSQLGQAPFADLDDTAYQVDAAVLVGPAPAGVRYWNLPTGSRLAYLEVPAKGPARPDPIIVVGGGPGEEDAADTSQTRFFGQLSHPGYDVYFYDQLGSGLSARLADPAGCTVARQVADLDAMRQRVGAQPRPYLETIRSFLLGKPLPAPRGSPPAPARRALDIVGQARTGPSRASWLA
jgi:hypothetical protein